MAATDDYSCELDDFALEKAKRELNEDPAERLGAVQALREWVQQQKHLSLPTGKSLLLINNSLISVKWIDEYAFWCIQIQTICFVIYELPSSVNSELEP